MTEDFIHQRIMKLSKKELAMKSDNNSLCYAIACIISLTSTVAGTLPVYAAGKSVEYLQTKPLADLLQGAHAQPVKGGPLRIPTITWPGDVATVDTDMEGIFKQEGLDVKLFCENDFAKQVKGVIDGDTPFLRGTMGMVESASEACDKAGCPLVVIYQLTWSNGGDVMVVRPGVNQLTDLRGKTIALQLYGPHMDFLTTVLAKAGLKPSDVKMKWLKELSVPSYDTHGKVVDPRSAFEAAPDLNATMVISPDASALTSGGKVGTGAEGSVKGAKILFSSKSANRIIADVYAVRADYFKNNRDKVEKFVHALMIGQERFSNLLKDKNANQSKYNQLLTRSADLLFGSPKAVPDVEGSLGDCQWVGYPGNVSFFTGKGTIRSFATLKNEITTNFLKLGLLKGKAPLDQAGWNYSKLAQGLKSGTTAVAVAPAFDTAKAQKAVEREIATTGGKTEMGNLYSFEIYFAPRQAAFTPSEYQDAFKKALEISQTMGGALVVIEGHNAPDALNKARSEGKSDAEIGLIEQAAKNLSYQRAAAVRQAYLEYCKQAGIKIDESQFLAVGVGTKSPKFPVPQTEEQWNANRRVVFRVKAVETELDSFKPAGK
jgi:ABC-type nitrate/sulfonate/bicarbonate transport system substrate-binding protein/outer membrane protein OmpA-like peptidoglycan-associated protein